MPDLKLLAIAFIAVLILGFVGFDFYANRQSQSVDIGPELLSELRALQQGQQESRAQKEANDVKHTSAMSVLQSELRALQSFIYGIGDYRTSDSVRSDSDSPLDASLRARYSN